MLLHICGSINCKTLSVTEIILATQSPGMEVVLNQPRAAWSTSLSNLVIQTLDITKEFDHLSIWSKYVSIKMIGKTIAGHLLQGNFATNRVATLNNEAYFINISAFLPQQKLVWLSRSVSRIWSLRPRIVWMSLMLISLRPRHLLLELVPKVWSSILRVLASTWIPSSQPSPPQIARHPVCVSSC